jgi:serine/threonine protein kinase
MQPGSTVNQRYEILSEIGRGGMGIVYRGRNIAMDRDVAIKVFNESLAQEGMLRAQREAQALANVKHENLVRVLSLETNEDGRLMLVFEFIEGQPLSEVLKSRGLTIDEATNLFEQLCNGLQTLHQNGFIHRDLKPSNLMVRQTPAGLHLTIIDFGLAKSIEKSQKLTATGTVMGTPQYMSPEQFAAHDVGPQSDMYSAACVLYEMLASAPPFADESPYMVANLHISAPVPPLPRKISNAAKLDTFFARALAKVPADRFGSAEEMLAKFKRAKEGQEITGNQNQATMPGASRKRQADRKRFLSITAATILLGVVVAIVVHNQLPTKPSSDDVDALAYQADMVLHTRFWNAEPQPDYRGARAYGTQQIKWLESQGEGKLNMAHLYADFASMCNDTDRENQPTDPDAAMGYMKKAFALSERYHATPKEMADIYLGMSNVYKAEGLYTTALDYVNKRSLLTGKHPSDSGHDGPLNYATILTRLGKYDEVLKYYEKNTVETPDAHGKSADAIRRCVARAFIEKGRYKEAIALLDHNEYVGRYSDLGREDDIPYYAIAHALLGNAKESEAFIEKGRSLRDPRKPLQPYQIGCSALNQVTLGDKKKAEDNIDDVLASTFQRNPKDTNRLYRDRLADAIYALKLGQEAAKRIGDKDRAAKCSQHAQQIKQELVKQGCLYPDSADAPTKS